MKGTGDRAWDDARRETRSAMGALRRATQENVRAGGSDETVEAVRQAGVRLQAALDREEQEWRRVTGRPA